MVDKKNTYAQKRKTLIRISLLVAVVLVIILFATKNFIAGGVCALITVAMARYLFDLVNEIDVLCKYITRLEMKIEQAEHIEANKKSGQLF